MTTFRVAAINRAGYPPQSQRRFRADLLTMRGVNPDLIAVAEAWWPRDRRTLAAVFPPAEWGRVSTGGWSGTVVLWRRARFSRRDSGIERLHGTVWVRGRVVSSARRVPWVEVHDRIDGDTITCGSVHATPSKHRFEAAHRAWVTGMAHLVELAEEQVKRGGVILAGDYNARRRDVLDAIGGRDGRVSGLPVRCPPTMPDAVEHAVLVGRFAAGVGHSLDVYSDHPVRWWDIEAK